MTDEDTPQSILLYSTRGLTLNYYTLKYFARKAIDCIATTLSTCCGWLLLEEVELEKKESSPQPCFYIEKP
jgi:hypothetical protein